MKFSHFYIFGFILLLSFTACVKAPSYANEPFITNVSLVNGNSFDEDDFDDAIILRIDFQDGDGDIGKGAGEESYIGIFIYDPLDDTPGDFAISEEIPSLGSTDDISGSIQVTMSGTWRCAIDDSTYVQATQFEVQIMDRARNMSNTVLTPVFNLNCK